MRPAQVATAAATTAVACATLWAVAELGRPMEPALVPPIVVADAGADRGQVAGGSGRQDRAHEGSRPAQHDGPQDSTVVMPAPAPTSPTAGEDVDDTDDGRGGDDTGRDADDGGDDDDREDDD